MILLNTENTKHPDLDQRGTGTLAKIKRTNKVQTSKRTLGFWYPGTGTSNVSNKLPEKTNSVHESAGAKTC